MKLDPRPWVNPLGFSIDKPRSWNDKKKRFEADARLHQRAKLVRHFYFAPRHTTAVDPRHLEKQGRYFDDNGMEIWPVSPEYVSYFRALGRCFDPSWEATMTIAFASLRRQNVTWEEMRYLLDELDGLPCRSFDHWTVENVAFDDIAEHKQVLAMWVLFQESQEDRFGRRTSGLSMSFQCLSSDDYISETLSASDPDRAGHRARHFSRSAKLQDMNVFAGGALESISRDSTLSEPAGQGSASSPIRSRTSSARAHLNTPSIVSWSFCASSYDVRWSK